MIKYFCDRCGKETNDTHICEECEQKELICGFKVGDEVITSTGEVGVITSICTCDRCKARGFFEPQVELKNGAFNINIYDTDKENGFSDFYKIGNHIFGNLDEETVESFIRGCKERLKKEQERLNKLEAQLDLVRRLKCN